MSSLVEVVRIHGSTHLRSVCVLATPTLGAGGGGSSGAEGVHTGGDTHTGGDQADASTVNPPLSHSMAWVTASNRLLLGELDCEAALRWTTAFVGRVGQHRIYTPYVTVYLVTALPKIPCVHRIYMLNYSKPYS